MRDFQDRFSQEGDGSTPPSGCRMYIMTLIPSGLIATQMNPSSIIITWRIQLAACVLGERAEPECRDDFVAVLGSPPI